VQTARRRRGSHTARAAGLGKRIALCSCAAVSEMARRREKSREMVARELTISRSEGTVAATKRRL